MNTVNLKGMTIRLNGALPQTGQPAPDFILVADDLSEKRLADYAGKSLVLNIFPSVDTGVCAASVRRFNQEASQLENTVVLCISGDLPFAMKRFCAAEGLDNVVSLSAYRAPAFRQAYGVEMVDGPLQQLCARAVFVLDAQHRIVHAQLSPVIGEAIDFEAALKALV